MAAPRRENILNRASAKFTDREKPREAFWKSYDYIKEHSDEFKILSYYGFGGVGKSRLCKEIQNELLTKPDAITDKVPERKFVSFSFEEAQDVISVLIRLSNLLYDEYEYELPMFNYALCSFMQKQGSGNQNKGSGVIKNKDAVEAVVDAAQLIPIIGQYISITAKYADKIADSIKSSRSVDKAMKDLIDQQTGEELKESIPVYFADDLTACTNGEPLPFVIILDTYEQLMNEVYRKESARFSDEWVRKVILRTNNILWVIAGQRYLEWASIDSYFDDETALEQHAIEGLDEKDVVEFLKSVNITDPQIVAAIYKYTQGVPIHLDLCVDLYFQISNPKPEDFEGDRKELPIRYLGKLEGAEKDLVYFLACAEKWDDSILDNEEVKYFVSTYRRVLGMSFIVSEGDQYFFHGQIRRVIYDDCDPIIKDKYYKYICKQLESGEISRNQKQFYMGQKISMDIEKINDLSDENRDKYLAECFDEWEDFFDNAFTFFEFSLFNKLYKNIAEIVESEQVSTEIKFKWDLLCFKKCYADGVFDELDSIYERLNSIDIRVFSDDVKLRYWANMVLYCEFSKDFDAILAYRLKQFHMLENKEDQQEDYHDAVKNLARAYLGCEKYDKAFELIEKYITDHKEILLNEDTVENRILLMDAFVIKSKIYRGLSAHEKSVEVMKEYWEVLSKDDFMASPRLIESALYYYNECAISYGASQNKEKEKEVQRKFIECYDAIPDVLRTRKFKPEGEIVFYYKAKLADNLEDKEFYLKKMVSLMEEVYRENPSYKFLSKLRRSTETLLSYYEDKHEENKECEEKIIGILDIIKKNGHGKVAAGDLCSSYVYLADYYHSIKQYDKELDCLNKRKELQDRFFPYSESSIPGVKWMHFIYNQRMGTYYSTKVVHDEYQEKKYEKKSYQICYEMYKSNKGMKNAMALATAVKRYLDLFDLPNSTIAVKKEALEIAKVGYAAAKECVSEISNEATLRRLQLALRKVLAAASNLKASNEEKIVIEKELYDVTEKLLDVSSDKVFYGRLSIIYADFLTYHLRKENRYEEIIELLDAKLPKLEEIYYEMEADEENIKNAEDCSDDFFELHYTSAVSHWSLDGDLDKIYNLLDVALRYTKKVKILKVQFAERLKDICYLKINNPSPDYISQEELETYFQE